MNETTFDTLATLARVIALCDISIAEIDAQLERLDRIIKDNESRLNQV